MSELGTKYECFSCGAKFYDLGKSEPLCPKCGANQKHAKQATPAAEAATARRRRREEVLRPVEDEEVIPEAEAELEEVTVGEVEEEREDEEEFEHEEE